MKFFNVFGFFFFNKKQPKKQNNQKQKTKHIHKQLKELNQGQVNNTRLRKSFLTHITRVFGFVGENPCEDSVLFIQIITIKNSKTFKIIHDNRSQGSTLRLKDLNIRANPF